MATENYKIDASWVKEYINIIKKDHNIYRDADDNLTKDFLTKFNRYRIDFPDMMLDKTFAHVFITRPDLNLLESSNKYSPLHKQVAQDPVCYYLQKTNPDIIRSLTMNLSSSHDLNPLLYARAASFETSDEVLDTVDYGETLTGHKIPYGKHNIESKSAGNISIQYVDDKELSIFKMHKVWTDYISKVYRGEWSPKEEYLKNRILDYACSIYYILCGSDGETIVFWSKSYGVFPINIPSSALSWTKGNILNNPEYTINYKFGFKEDFNPLTLAEFNMNSRGGLVYAKTYDKDSLSTGPTFVGSPFVDTVESNGSYEYKLRFRRN